jgi:hypothetical protein
MGDLHKGPMLHVGGSTKRHGRIGFRIPVGDFLISKHVQTGVLSEGKAAETRRLPLTSI